MFVASFQGRSENLFNIGLEHLAIHGPFEHEGSGNAIMPQGCNESGSFPIAMQYLLDEALAPWRSAIEAGDVGRDAGFINEHEPLRIKSRLPPLQSLTIGGDVRPILLGGVQAFF